jgi:hypothetical protein
VKDQGSSGYCCAFAAVSCTEALVNLYFNKKVDLDLSEQQAACCNGTTNPWSGMTLFSPLNYIMNHGVYDENAYPFVNDSVSGLQCHDASSTPNEIVKIASIASVSINHEDSIKKALIKYGPLSSLYKRSTIDSVMPGHAMSIVGYFDVHVGDTLRALRHYTGCDYCWGLDTAIIVEDKEYKQIGNIIGKTCWVFKNSSSDVPFMNILFQDLGGMYCPYRLGTPITWTSKSITLNGTDSIHTDIVCEDADGDGYYFWGIGNRPAACPSWIPSTADGDDSDFTKGKMLETPVFGELESLNPDDSPSLVISSNTTYTARQVLYSHIRITGNATLTIKDILNLLGRTTIIIDPGAQLKVDGGTVSNVNLSIASGGKVTLTNGGKLILRTNTDLEIPAGAIMDISDGEIIRSSDF